VIEPAIVLLNVFVPLQVLVFAKSVEEAAVIVCVSPKLNSVPFTVIEELVRAELGRFKVEEAAMKGIPVAPVTTKPLLPIPHVVEVLNSVESCAVEVFQSNGKRAEILVVPKVEEPPVLQVEVPKSPRLFTVTHAPGLPERYGAKIDQLLFTGVSSLD
jgi:hypothetical protein